MDRSLRVGIIGAGPAGAAAAAHLASAGHRVSIFEAKAFPRLKVCGEYVSPAATADLESVVPADELLAAGARRVTIVALQLGDRCIERPAAAAWSLSRGTLDALLLERAARAGAEVLQPVSVAMVRYSDEHVAVTLAAPRIGERELLFDLVVHADGTGVHDPSGATPVARGLTGHKCQLDASSLPAAERRGVRMRSGGAGAGGAYIGSVEVEGGRVTLALVADTRTVRRHRGRLDDAVSEMWPAYRPAWRITPWLSSQVARSAVIRPGHPRSIRIGNAAAAVDPVGGEGIGLALWSARVLGVVLDRHLARAGSERASIACAAGVQRELLRRYRARLAVRRHACRLGAELLLRPRLLSVAWPLLSSSGMVVDGWMRLTGKPAAQRTTPLLASS